MNANKVAFTYVSFAEIFGAYGPVLEVEGQTVIARVIHLPHIRMVHEIIELVAFHTCLAYLAAISHRQNERHVPVSGHRRGLKGTLEKFSLIYEYMFRFHHKGRRSTDVPAVGSSVTQDIQR